MTDDDTQNGAADLPIDQELAERVVALYAHVDEVLNDLRVPDDERKEVEQNLMEAIAADLLVRLGEKLSEDDKKELANMGEELDGKEPDLNAVAGFFRGKFSQEELVHALAEATESVLTEFTDAMR
ncbi:hypothetical protein HY090_03250 [Candidatus Kaiserbacteria bacterium]|nr:hypothetical protein [Candidatus Kaiserbacteria bacterium]